MKKILFLGEKEIGEKAFDLLLDGHGKFYTINVVVSNKSPDVWWESNNIYMASLDRFLFIPNDKKREKEIIRAIKKHSIDLIISVQHPWILSRSVLQSVDYQTLNLHNAKLPEYKGNNAVNHAILNGDSTYTSTVHWMTEKVDSGEIAIEETFKLDSEITAKELYNCAISAGLKAFQKLINYLKEGDEIPKKPMKGISRYYSRDSIGKLRRIENINDPIEVDRKSRAFFFPPFEPAFYENDKKKVYILAQKFLELDSNFRI
jgi:methionyl-tRNA formyltransferase